MTIAASHLAGRVLAGRVLAGRVLAGTVMAGAATGARSLTGIGALILAADPHAVSPLGRLLPRRWVKTAAGALVAGEYVIDKLPATPSRLAGLGVTTRIAGALACATVIAHRTAPHRRGPTLPHSHAHQHTHAHQPGRGDPSTPAPARAAAADHALPRREVLVLEVPVLEVAGLAVVALAGAAVTAWLGLAWRQCAAARLGHGWIAAVMEDAAAVGLAVTATRLTTAH